MAHYDQFNYPAYWQTRAYEHGCEGIALKAFLSRIPKIDKILEIGAGFGRLAPLYTFRAQKVILSDPSLKLLAIARKKFTRQKKVIILQSKIENLADKIKSHSVDLVIIIRVLHHLKDLNATFKIINHVLKPNGFLILEFANKNHFKSSFLQFLHGNFTFPMDIWTKDLRSRRHVRDNSIPFNNYHPEIVKNALCENGFRVICSRSVSNIRQENCKNLFQTQTLLTIEKFLQEPLSWLNFGPSIFLLAQKQN